MIRPDGARVVPILERIAAVRHAARDRTPISGLTHCFYRYPARFSPSFAAAAIEAFSSAGDIVLDPYVGGGTTLVEAFVRGRIPIGCDLNSLSEFIGRVKTAPLLKFEEEAVRVWATAVVGKLFYDIVDPDLEEIVCHRRTRNLSIPSARPIKKLVALCILSLDCLPTSRAVSFARCAILNTGEWALNGRKHRTPLPEFRHRIRETVEEMLAGNADLVRRLRSVNHKTHDPMIITDTAASLPSHEPFADGVRADLVVTSPPYPGIHMLYHRWQVDGRRETPAPYWIAGCKDGQGNAYYNFADRNDKASDRYFLESLKTLRGIRRVLKRGAYFVQLISFGQPQLHLKRYLINMSDAGFDEARPDNSRRAWRSVPGRRWHANFKGRLNSSREVLLIHRAS